MTTNLSKCCGASVKWYKPYSDTPILTCGKCDNPCTTVPEREECKFQILSPHYDNGHNGGMWCAEPYPCKRHGDWKALKAVSSVNPPSEKQEEKKYISYGGGLIDEEGNHGKFVTVPSPIQKAEDWERTFFEKFGANKIWVVPSEDDVQTVLDIWSFIRQTRKEAVAKREEEMREDVMKLYRKTSNRFAIDALDKVLSALTEPK